MERIAEVSPRFKARIAGVLYLVIIVAALFAEVFVRGRFIVYGDASATATNIMAHESIYRLGGAADLIAFACDVAVALIFYELFKPVSGALSLLAAFFRLMHVSIVGASTAFHFAPLVLLGGTRFLSAFDTNQSQALALVSLRLHALGYNIALVFFGCHCLLIGYLIWRSTFMPRVLGALMSIAGSCYLANSFANLLSPTIAGHLFPWILLPGALAEWGLTAWLPVVGLNVQRWNGRARAAAPLN